MAITARYSLTAVVGLVFIVAAYEIGDYLVGSGARNPFEGPVAGATAIVVTTFAITAIGLKPFVFPGSFALAALAATLCPAGQVMASAILPKVDAPASALRRIDSLLPCSPGPRRRPPRFAPGHLKRLQIRRLRAGRTSQRFGFHSVSRAAFSFWATSSQSKMFHTAAKKSAFTFLYCR